MGTRMYGIIAAQSPDREGETISIDGVDISNLKRLKDEHPEQDQMWHEIGDIRSVKKIYRLEDCEDHKQKRCWEFAQVPFIYGEGELADDFDHPNARAAASLVKFSMRPDSQLDIGWSIDGGIAERKTQSGKVTEDPDEGKILSRTVGLGASLTVKRCNPKCRIWLENDLQKSYKDIPAPSNYLELLKKSRDKKSFHESMPKLEMELYIKLNKLKKSLGNYLDGFTETKCDKCGEGVRFFKSGDVPNQCGKCASPYSMKKLWKALNK